MDVDELRREVEQVNWFHQIDLGNGIVTPGPDPTPSKVERVGLPVDLSGRTVLDIGAWDGAFSFEAERRGAARVLATDSHVWQGRVRGHSREGFDLARASLGSRVEDRLVDVMDLDPADVGTFDVVLFLGVLYHLRHPLAGLERALSVTAPGGLVIIETHVDMLHLCRPAAALYPRAELGQDETNWFGPNPAGVLALCQMAGFASAEPYGTIPTASSTDIETVTSERFVVHARP